MANSAWDKSVVSGRRLGHVPHLPAEAGEIQRSLMTWLTQQGSGSTRRTFYAMFPFQRSNEQDKVMWLLSTEPCSPNLLPESAPFRMDVWLRAASGWQCMRSMIQALCLGHASKFLWEVLSRHVSCLAHILSLPSEACCSHCFGFGLCTSWALPPAPPPGSESQLPWETCVSSHPCFRDCGPRWSYTLYWVTSLVAGSPVPSPAGIPGRGNSEAIAGSGSGREPQPHQTKIQGHLTQRHGCGGLGEALPDNVYRPSSLPGPLTITPVVIQPCLKTSVDGKLSVMRELSFPWDKYIRIHLSSLCIADFSSALWGPRIDFPPLPVAAL